MLWHIRPRETSQDSTLLDGDAESAERPGSVRRVHRFPGPPLHPESPPPGLPVTAEPLGTALGKDKSFKSVAPGDFLKNGAVWKIVVA